MSIICISRLSNDRKKIIWFKKGCPSHLWHLKLFFFHRNRAGLCSLVLQPLITEIYSFILLESKNSPIPFQL